MKNYAVLRNINIKNYNLNENGYYRGLIGDARKATIENVNIEDVNIKCKGNCLIGGLCAHGEDLFIKNVTYNKLNINAEGTHILGGLIGEGNMTANNIYMNNIEIKSNSTGMEDKIGGFVGQLSGSKIKNVIISGKINSNAYLVGGISGYGMANMENSLVDINILSNSSYVG